MRLPKWLLVGCAVLLACTYDASRLRAPRPDAAVAGSGGSSGGDAAADSAPDADLADGDAPVEAERTEVLDVRSGPDTTDAVDAPITEAPGAPVDAGEDAVDAPEDAVDAPATEAATVPTDVESEAGSVGGTGGAAGTGGVTSTGGSSDTGGTSGTGGTSDMGGVSGTGGTVGSGGMQGTGGVVGTGGVSSTGGTTTTVVGTTVTFLNGMAQGPMTGYGCVSLGTQDTLTSPTCGGAQIKGLTPSQPALTFNSSCAPADITWNSTTSLCVSGSVPALPANPTEADYDRNWGVLVGVNVREPAQAIGTTHRSITFILTGQPTTALRAVVHLRSDPDNTTYCANMTPGMPVYFTSFNTECWENTGRYLLSSDVAKIDLVGAHVPATSSTVSVKNLCLTRIDLGK
jgi:hypothetical protein